MATLWKVQVVRCSDLAKWPYPVGYFPRDFRYLREARMCAGDAIAAGARSVRIEGSNGVEYDIKKLSKEPIVKPKYNRTVIIDALREAQYQIEKALDSSPGRSTLGKDISAVWDQIDTIVVSLGDTAEESDYDKEGNWK